MLIFKANNLDIVATSIILVDTSEISEMNKKVMKNLAGFAVLLIVLSAISFTALAAETDILDGTKNANGWFKERPAKMEKPQFETDEERIEFEMEKILDRIDRQIERLENINIEDTDDETITSDIIEDWISQLEEIKNSIDVDGITDDVIQEAEDELHILMHETISSGVCEPMGKQMGHRFCRMVE